MFEAGSSFSSVINEKCVKELAIKIARIDKKFDQKNFLGLCKFDGHKFGARLNLVKIALKTCLLSADKRKNCLILVKSLPPEIASHDAGKSYWDHFIVMALGDYVQEVALETPLTKKDLFFYLSVLKEMTKAFSSEASVRPFIIKYPKETMEFLLSCAGDKNVHVRRWASEGCRPRLPLAIALPKFKNDPTPVLAILEKLKDDPHDYVYRSVANNLNDIAKDNPRIVTALLKKWNHNPSSSRSWIIKHALRTLIKKGNAEALEIMGIKPMKYILNDISHQEKIKKGDTLVFKTVITNRSTAGKYIVDYILEFKKKSGSREKVFKLATFTLKANEQREISGKIVLKDYSTRKITLGEHSLSLQINGKRHKKSHFEVY